MANKNDNQNLISILDAIQGNPLRVRNDGGKTAPVKKTTPVKKVTTGGASKAPVKKTAPVKKVAAPAKKTTTGGTSKSVTKSATKASASSISETASTALHAAFEKGYQQALTNLSSFLKGARKQAESARSAAAKKKDFLEAMLTSQDIDFLDFMGDYVAAARQHKAL